MKLTRSCQEGLLNRSNVEKAKHRSRRAAYGNDTRLLLMQTKAASGDGDARMNNTPLAESLRAGSKWEYTYGNSSHRPPARRTTGQRSRQVESIRKTEKEVRHVFDDRKHRQEQTRTT